MSIKQKLFNRLQEEIGEEFGQEIADALDNEEIDENIKELVENDQIELIGYDNKPLLKRQLTLLQEQQAQLGGTGGDEDILTEGDSLNIRTSSPDSKRLENAELQIHE